MYDSSYDYQAPQFDLAAFYRPLPMVPVSRVVETSSDVSVSVSAPWRKKAMQVDGYGLNLDGRPGHNSGRDGVLVFDVNRDGKYDAKDISRTNDIMKAATGNFDFNHDGRLSKGEIKMGYKLMKQFAKMDLNHDGRLEGKELEKAGARVWVDGNRDTRMDAGEMHTMDQLPREGRGYGSTRLESVDPFSQTAQLSSSRRWFCGMEAPSTSCSFDSGYDYGNGYGQGYTPSMPDRCDQPTRPSYSEQLMQQQHTCVQPWSYPSTSMGF